MGSGLSYRVAFLGGVVSGAGFYSLGGSPVWCWVVFLSCHFGGGLVFCWFCVLFFHQVGGASVGWSWLVAGLFASGVLPVWLGVSFLHW